MKYILFFLLFAYCVSATSAQTKTIAANKPLIVIDSSIVGMEFIQLNSMDIKEVSVLKDSTSTRIYGPAGKNGVILIKTKAPSKYKFLSLKEVLAERNLSLGGTNVFIINNKPVRDTSLLKLDTNNIKSVVIYSKGFEYLAAPYNALKVIQIFTKDYDATAVEPEKKPGTIMIRGEKTNEG